MARLVLAAGFWLWSVIVLWCRKVGAEVDPIIAKGSHFFYKTNGTAFFVRGITYFPAYNQGSGKQNIDALADPAMCARDIPYISALGMNVVYIPYVDPALEHSACMDALAQAGIYVIAQLAFSVDAPRASHGYTETALTQSIGILNSLSQNSNTLAFLVGADLVAEDVPYLKANARDLKQHVSDKKYREIPLGWAVNSNATSPERGVVDAMMCSEPRMDFLGLINRDTDLSNCTSTTEIIRAARNFANATVPVFFIDSGCPVDGGGHWDYVSETFMENITSSLSGVVVAEYFSTVYTANLYGLVSLNLSSDHEVQPSPAYYSLSSVLAIAKTSLTDASRYTPTATLPTCPMGTSYNASTILPPRPLANVCSCIYSTLRCTARRGAVDNMDPEALDLALQNICENNESVNCQGIISDPQQGRYGAFSYCNNTVRYSWAASKNLQRHGDAACNFNGTVQLLGPRPTPDPLCASLLEQAGHNGEGKITQTSFPTGTSTGGVTLRARRGLSSSEKAGIGVGVSVFIALILGIVIILRRRRAENKHSLQPDEPFQKPELDDTEKKDIKACYEAPDSKEVAELHADGQTVEAGDEGIVYELCTEERPAEVEGGRLD